MNGGEVGDEGEKSLEDLEPYVCTLRHAVVHCLHDTVAGLEMGRRRARR